MNGRCFMVGPQHVTMTNDKCGRLIVSAYQGKTEMGYTQSVNDFSMTTIPDLLGYLHTQAGCLHAATRPHRQQRK